MHSLGLRSVDEKIASADARVVYKAFSKLRSHCH
jgi:hypothetical protein